MPRDNATRSVASATRCTWFDCSEYWVNRKPNRSPPAANARSIAARAASRRRLGSPDRIRTVRCTGCRAARTSRVRCGTPARTRRLAPGTASRTAPCTEGELPLTNSTRVSTYDHRSPPTRRTRTIRIGLQRNSRKSRGRRARLAAANSWADSSKPRDSIGQRSRAGGGEQRARRARRLGRASVLPLRVDGRRPLQRWRTGERDDPSTRRTLPNRVLARGGAELRGSEDRGACSLRTGAEKGPGRPVPARKPPSGSIAPASAAGTEPVGAARDTPPEAARARASPTSATSPRAASSCRPRAPPPGRGPPRAGAASSDPSRRCSGSCPRSCRSRSARRSGSP